MNGRRYARGGVVRSYQDGGDVEDDDQQSYQVAQASPATMRRGGPSDAIQDAVGDTLNPVVQGMYERLNPPKGSGSAYQDILNYQSMRNPRVQGAMQAGAQMPPDPRQQAWRAPAQQETMDESAVPAGSSPSWGGRLSDMLHRAVSPGINPRAGMHRPVIEPEYAGGGYVDDEEDLAGQGSDDATLDPMAMVNSALNYGKKKYGIPTGDQGEMGFDDGGVVPTQDEGDAGGGQQPTDPRQAMAYLSGDGAVSQEIAQALEQGVDPRGQMNPTQRAVAAIGVAPTDEAKFGMLQYYRTKYNGFAAAAKAAMQRGDMGEAAHQATQAMDAVPNGQRTQFAPAPGGLAMISKPAFGQGGGKPQQPQQSFDDGGVVEDDEALARLQPQPQADPPDAVADAPTEQVPVQEPLTGPQPSIMPVQTVAQILDKGFDAQFDQNPPPKAAIASPMFQPQGPGSAYALDQADAQRSAQLGGWESATEQAAAVPPRPMQGALEGVLDSRRWGGGAEPPAPTTGSEAATRQPESTSTAPVTAPVTPPAAGVAPTSADPNAVIDENRVNPFTGGVRRAAPGTFGSREAARRAGTEVPLTEEAARGGGTEDRGVVPTRRRDQGPLSADAADRLELDQYLQDIHRLSGQRNGGGGPGFPTYKTYDPRSSAQQMGVVPTAAKPGYVPPAKDSPEVLKFAKTLPEWRAIPARGTPAGDTSSGIPGTVRESAQAKDSLQNRIPQTQWGNITKTMIQEEAERIRDLYRDRILETARQQLAANDPNKPRIPSAQEAALAAHEAARRIPNNFGNSTGTINVQTDPRSTARDWLNRGGRPANAEEAEIERAQRRAGAAYPMVGADQGKRNAEVAGELKRGDELRKDITKSNATLDKQDKINQGWTDRERIKGENAATMADKKAAATTQRDVFKAKTKAILQGETESGKRLRTLVQANPGILAPGNEFELKRQMGPGYNDLGIKTRDDIDAIAETVFGVGSPRTGVVPTTGGADTIAQAAKRGLTTGTRAEHLGEDGLMYEYVVTPKGTWRRDPNVPGRSP